MTPAYFHIRFYKYNIIIVLLVLISGVNTSFAQENDTTYYKKQILQLNKALESQSKEFDKLLSTKEVIVVVPAQDTQKKSKNYTSVGMNMTSLLSRLVPFGNGIPLAGPTTLMLRRYSSNRAFRLALGLNSNLETDRANASLRIGFEKKKELNTKFVFTRGIDAMLSAGSFNIPGFRFSNINSAFFGGLISFGLEYKLDKQISVGTETLLILGLENENDVALAFKIVPPLALYLHANLN
ncbi:MAG: hypothetical protein ACOYOA_01180 [Saprospiraceae bacterium]